MQQQLEQELQLEKLAEQQRKEREEQEAAQEEENTGRFLPTISIYGHKYYYSLQLQSLWLLIQLFVPP